jgi:sporulation protein YlmC with PRC-barrel domain
MLVPALALSFAVAAQAAGDADKRGGMASPAASPPANTSAKAVTGNAMRHDMRMSELVGKDVTNPKGENLGEIKDLVVDTTSGKVQYAVISFGGFMGLGDKLFAYPLDKFERTADRGKLVLNVDKEKMKSAPGFDDKNWPNFTTAAYRGEVDQF